MLNVNENINGMHVECTFEKGINCIDLSESGSGKTFLMTLIKAYCVKNNISYRAFDYDSTADSIERELRSIGSTDFVILMDNADLYFNDELRRMLDNCINSVIIVSIKQRYRLGRNYKLYNTSYKGGTLICKEI